MSTGNSHRFRHGDLRRALLHEALELARESGPDAIVLREVTRRAGVVPNAAYRHYPDRAALVEAVTARAQEMAAIVMRAEVARSQEGLAEGSAAAARARLDAVGRGYVRFALDEPGLFKVGFARARSRSRALSAGEGPAPFRLLSDAIAHLVRVGVVDASRSPGMELPAWSAVHGLACLLTDGALADMPADSQRAAIDSVLHMVRAGLEQR